MVVRLVLAYIFVQAVSCGIMMDTGPDPALLDVEPVISPQQMALNARCVGKCKTEVCYVPDDQDCRNFITCQRDAKGRYHADIQPCAFGTYWAGLPRQKKITCDLPQNVICNVDYCRGQIDVNYSHNDGNCKTFWTCTSKGPEPKCCGEMEYFDEGSSMCVPDTMGLCNQKCPIKQDACLTQGVPTEHFDDGNCRTFWDCEDRKPHPVCCPDGQGYDPRQGVCVANGCMDECPPEYKQDMCLTAGVTKYALHDNSCRTYMLCNAIDGDERWCCPPGHIFVASEQACIKNNGVLDVTCTDTCPFGYKEACHLKRGTSPNFYQEEVNGQILERPCAPGSVFDETKCACGTVVKDSPDNSCNMELDILFDRPNWLRTGSQNKTEINSRGIIMDGIPLNGRTTYLFDGGLVFRAMYFKQSFPNFYLNVVFNPDQFVSTGRQVILSNCITDLAGPSLELSLENDRVVLSLVTDTLSASLVNAPFTPVVATVGYTPGAWNDYTAIYNGQNVYVLNKVGGSPSFDMQALNGSISVAAEGLDIGGCAINVDLNEGFRGSMAQLKFTKCLKQAWIDAFNADTQTLQNGAL